MTIRIAWVAFFLTSVFFTSDFFTLDSFAVGLTEACKLPSNSAFFPPGSLLEKAVIKEGRAVSTLSAREQALIFRELEALPKGAHSIAPGMNSQSALDLLQSGRATLQISQDVVGNKLFVSVVRRNGDQLENLWRSQITAPPGILRVPPTVTTPGVSGPGAGTTTPTGTAAAGITRHALNGQVNRIAKGVYEITPETGGSLYPALVSRGLVKPGQRAIIRIDQSSSGQVTSVVIDGKTVTGPDLSVFY